MIVMYNIILNPNSKSKNKKIKRKENRNENKLSLLFSILTSSKGFSNETLKGVR